MKVRILILSGGQVEVVNQACQVGCEGTPIYLIINPQQDATVLQPVPESLVFTVGEDDPSFDPEDCSNLPQCPPVNVQFTLEMNRRQAVIPEGMNELLTQIEIDDLQEVEADGDDITGMFADGAIFAAIATDPVDRPIHRP